MKDLKTNEYIIRWMETGDDYWLQVAEEYEEMWESFENYGEEVLI